MILLLIGCVASDDDTAAGFGWTEVWADRFDGAAGAPPSDVWVPDLGAGGWGNAELQAYTADNAALDGDGHLGGRVGVGHPLLPGRQLRLRRRRGGGGSGEADGHVDHGPLHEGQPLADLGHEVPFVRDLTGQAGIGGGGRLHGLDRLERAGMHPAAAEVGDGHPFRLEPRDRRRHQHADRLHAGRLELDVGLRPHVDARGPRRPAAERAVEGRAVVNVVEHGRPLDARHRADHVGELLLHRHAEQFLLRRPALPRAVALQGPAEAAAELAGQRLGVDEGPHVGALPRPRHPDAAIFGAMAGELGAVEGRLHDRQF
jgi:hypothetical protein